jgi:hypothetical protein
VARTVRAQKVCQQLFFCFQLKLILLFIINYYVIDSTYLILK